MVFINIPAEDSAHFEMQTTLEGVEYNLAFKYNGREDRWYFDLRRGVEAIRIGAKVVTNVLFKVGSGGLIFFAGQADLTAPKWQELGTRVGLIYATGDELA